MTCSRKLSACSFPPSDSWSWLPGIITVGCGKEDREDTRELSTGVGIDPREWKKSPRKMQPGVVPAGEEEQRERRRSIVARHAGRVWVLGEWRGRGGVWD